MEPVDLDAPILVVHFWATWNNCDREMDNLVQTLRPEYEPFVSFRSLETDLPANHDFCTTSEVRNLPALVLFKQGRHQETETGLRCLEEWRRILDSWTSGHSG